MKRQLETIGLGGNGDEVDAVQAIERHFAVQLDYGDAADWHTVGDLFASLLRALPPERCHAPDIWPSFATILCEETGADATLVGPETLLLGLPLRTVIGRRLRPNSRSKA